MVSDSQPSLIESKSRASEIQDDPVNEHDKDSSDEANLEGDADGEHCSICLQPYINRTVIPNCSHEFCFECIMMWTG